MPLEPPPLFDALPLDWPELLGRLDPLDAPLRDAPLLPREDPPLRGVDPPDFEPDFDPLFLFPPNRRCRIDLRSPACFSSAESTAEEGGVDALVDSADTVTVRPIAAVRLPSRIRLRIIETPAGGIGAGEAPGRDTSECARGFP